MPRNPWVRLHWWVHHHVEGRHVSAGDPHAPVLVAGVSAGEAVPLLDALHRAGFSARYDDSDADAAGITVPQGESAAAIALLDELR